MREDKGHAVSDAVRAVGKPAREESMSEHESQAKGGQIESDVRPRLTKEGLTSYFQQFLGGDRGEASADVLSDLCLNVQYETEQRLKEKWLPIETAPKDGTNFLACSSASSVFLAHYANGVVDSSDWTDADGYLARYATHWMPLPERPEEI